MSISTVAIRSLVMALFAAFAAQTADAKTASVLSHSQAAGPTTPGTFTCPPRVDATPLALNAATEYGVEQGDTLIGSSVDKVCVYPLADGSIAYEGVVRFTGRLTGCGTGSVSFRTVGSLSPPDPVDRNDEGSLQVIRGTGTMGLAGLSGKVPYTGTVDPSLVGTNFVKGTLSC